MRRSYPMMNKRPVSLLAGLALVAAGLAGCSSDPGPDDAVDTFLSGWKSGDLSQIAFVEPTGAKVARYSLFADQSTLDQHFSDAIAQNSELVMCPGGDVDSPTEWYYNANPDDVAGQVACGTYDGNPDVTWTKNVDLLLADAQGPNLEDLHKWWNDFG